PKQVPTALVADPNTWPMQPVPAVKAGALKVVVVGDSIANNLGDALGTWASQRTDVVTYNLAIPACPISRGRDRRVGTSPDKVFNVQPVCGWWDDPTSSRYKAFQQFDPDLVVVHDGVNEVFNRKLPSWDDWLGPEDPRFDQWVTGEYQTAIDRWRAEGHQVLMVNAACADWSFYDNFSQLTNPDRRVQMLNSVVYPALNGVTVADMYDRVCPDGGQYTNYVEGIPDGRPDGFHFSSAAAVALITNWLGPLVLQAARGTVP
ncbi:MAG: putative acyltransferase, partial [Frankiales bacterium]|nr:putative acyltransferase [Frankiales bacterium]